jgi:anti-sigma B factor antagonist
MSMLMSRSGDALHVFLREPLVVSNRQQVKMAVLEEIDDGARHVRIDMTGMSYIDSSGLGALVSLSRKLRERGGSLRLANPQADVRSLLAMTRLDTLFMIDGDDDDGAPRSAPLPFRRPGPAAGAAESEEPGDEPRA